MAPTHDNQNGRDVRNEFRRRPYKPAVLFLFVIFFLLLGITPVHADPVFLPTEEALNTTYIPPRDRVDLARRLLGLTEISAPPQSAPERQVGEQQIFHVTNASDNTLLEIPSTLRVVGEHIYLWVENSGSVDVEQLQALADAFDHQVYDVVRALWGSEANPGIDGDPRIHGLFSNSVGSGVAAYFMSDHTLPDEVVPSSNEHEMFFFNLSTFNSTNIAYIESVVGHEFQHMIRVNLQPNEETWMNEGFSEFTQVHLFEVGMGEIYAFLNAPNTQLNTWYEDISARGANYGAASLFITYFHDRYGLDALRMLSADNAPRGLQSVDNVLQLLGQPGVDVFFADWVIANFLFDPYVATGAYGYRSLRLDTSNIQRTPINKYPSELSQTVSQYATDYFDLIDYGDADSLTFTITAPPTVDLIAAPVESGDRIFYSNRADMSDTTLTRAFDLTGLTSATLEYRLWYHLEEHWDHGYVMVSSDGGATWAALSTDHTTDVNPYQTAYGSAYTGRSGGGTHPVWVDERVSLDAYAGEEILIRFEMITDDAINQPGMAIDDVRIDELGYSADFATDATGWESNGWIWTDNILNQRAWVQVIQQTEDDAFLTRWEYPADADDTWTVELVDGVERVSVAVSAVAPVTTVPMPYDLSVDVAAP